MYTYNATVTAPVISEAARARQKAEIAERNARLAQPIPVWEAVWTTVEGIEVLQVAGSNYVAIPVNGRRSSARFDICQLDPREFYCQVTKAEVRQWLADTARHREELPATGTI